jgi:methanogenic corrinoid protein MtbC1
MARSGGNCPEPWMVLEVLGIDFVWRGPSMSDTTPSELMSIGTAVSDLQTEFPEMSHSGLRFLEREGLLSSVRTAGGHRLYSRADIDRVALIKRWQRQGLSLDDIRELLARRDALPSPSGLAQEFLRLVLEQDLEQAQQLVLGADEAGVDPATLFFDVLRPVLIEVGEQWAAGTLSVYQEKETSSICRELIAELTLRHSPPYPHGPLLISACVEGERHELGLAMVNGLLRQRGYRVRYLGPDVAIRFLLDSILANRPAAILLSATLESNIPTCVEAIDAIAAAFAPEAPPATILVGGRATDAHCTDIEQRGGIPVRADDALRSVDSLLSQSFSS